MSEYRLDKWDCKLIKMFKHASVDNPVTIEGLQLAWADRCAMDVDHVQLTDVTHHLLHLVYKLNLLDNEYAFLEFITSINPERNFIYETNRKLYNMSTACFDLILLSRLDSLLTNTDVAKLPGYREFIMKEMEETCTAKSSTA